MLFALGNTKLQHNCNYKWDAQLNTEREKLRLRLKCSIRYLEFICCAWEYLVNMRKFVVSELCRWKLPVLYVSLKNLFLVRGEYWVYSYLQHIDVWISILFRQRLSTVTNLKHFTCFSISNDCDAASALIEMSWSCVRSLMSLELTTGTDVMGHEKLISLCVNWGGRFLIHPKSAYPIYISKGSNPFNFHEIGCLLEGDLDSWNIWISPIGVWLRGHHTWEITVQIIDVSPPFISST